MIAVQPSNQKGFQQHSVTSKMLPFQHEANRKVTIQQAVFDFGDDLNDLNQLEMQISYEEVELQIKFNDYRQL